MGDNERSTEPFRVLDLIFLTLNLFGVSAFGFSAPLIVLASEVGVVQEVSVAYNATVGQLYNDLTDYLVGLKFVQ